MTDLPESGAQPTKEEIDVAFYEMAARTLDGQPTGASVRISECTAFKMSDPPAAMRERRGEVAMSLPTFGQILEQIESGKQWIAKLEDEIKRLRQTAHPSSEKIEELARCLADTKCVRFIDEAEAAKDFERILREELGGK